MVQTGRIEFTHLDKVFWPGKGYTKGALVAYYQALEPYIFPYLQDRPCNLFRQPNGIKDKAFFQKDVQSLNLPSWTQTVKVYSETNEKDIEYLVCNSFEAVLYQVQLGCIEINPWNSRLQQLKCPDWAVIDIDPDGNRFNEVVSVALQVKKVCDELSIPCYPKTSGKSGMHIFIPMEAKYNYVQVRQFAELIANLVHRTTDPLTSLVRDPQKRRGKIYLDYLQNRESQTLAAPYCVRPTVAASVSAPLNWSEVNKNLRPDNFTIINMQQRLKEVGDLWKPVIGKGIDLAKVLGQIE